MADGFFDGTLDDFFDDQGFCELAGLALRLPSPSPPPSPSRFSSTSRPLLMGSHLSSLMGGRSTAENNPFLPREASVGGIVVGGAAVPPSELRLDSLGPSDAGFDSGPTRPAASHRRPSIPTRHPEPPSLNSSTSHHAPQRRAPLNGSHRTLASNHSRRRPSISTLNTTARRYYRGEARFCDNPDTFTYSTSPSEPHQNSSLVAAATLSRRPPAQRSTPADAGDKRNPGYMSGNPRHKAGLRPGDLTMPAPPSQAGPSSASASRRSRRSASRALQPEPSQPAHKRKREASTDDFLFGGDSFEDREVVDLVDKDELPAEILSNSQEETKNFVKLSTFDCVICMDSVTDLTVTHCGHLFCSECLQSALNMDINKKVCPICRQKIDRMPPSGKFGQKAKGFYPLELKLMTKKTLGKRPQNSS